MARLLSHTRVITPKITNRMIYLWGQLNNKRCLNSPYSQG
jgi:hypothetical protein